MRRVGGAEPDGQPDQPFHLGGQLAAGPGHVGPAPPGGGQRRVRVGARLTGVGVAVVRAGAAVGGGGQEGLVRPGQPAGARVVGEHAVDPAQRVVPGGPGAGPVGGQPLVAGEDLLHHRVGAAGGPGQPLQVAARVGEPVRMVDPEAVQHAFAVQPQQHAVGGLEHLGTLDPDGDQLVDGEEPPVVQLCAGQPPPGRAVPLPGEQLGQRQRPGAGAQRQHVVVVAEGVAVDGQLVEDGAEPVAEQGQQYPAASGGVHRARLGGPVDVEPVRVRRVGAVPQHLPERPVEVLGDGDRHVVGHHVGDQPQVVPVRLGGQRPQGLLAAELLGYPPWSTVS